MVSVDTAGLKELDLLSRDIDDLKRCTTIVYLLAFIHIWFSSELEHVAES